jgi:hypothetical protein
MISRLIFSLFLIGTGFVATPSAIAEDCDYCDHCDTCPECIHRVYCPGG